MSLIYGRGHRVTWIADLTGDSQVSTLKSRAEVPAADTWDLKLIFPDDAAWEAEFSDLASRFEEINAFKGTLAKSAGDLAKALEFESSLDRSSERLNQYAGLRLSEDSSNDDALDRDGRLSSLCAKISETSSWIAPEIQEIPDEMFEKFLANPLLADWQISLQNLRRLKPHILSNKEERLISLSMPAVGGHHETFSQLTNVDMTFGTVRDDRGQEIELTQSSFSSLLQRPDRIVRKEAFQKFYTEFTAHRYSLASSLASSIKGDVFLAKARHYSSAREASLFADNVPTAVYDSLIEAVRSRLPVLHKYYSLRQRLFNLPDLHVYDTYAPLVSAVQSDVLFDQAIEMVVKSLHPLGSEYTKTLSSGLREERWCDRYENKGKRSGAFSYGTYQGPPYILMNYKQDVFSDIYTLAHEAGHSMHTWYSRRTQNFQNYHYPIFLAEVASTFNEILLTEHLLSETKERSMRAYLINRQIDDLRGTLFRQTMFAEFEKIAHAAEESGAALTLETFRKMYRSLLDTYFGKGVVIDEELELECLRIPHFYSAFYVYKYATGISAAITLADQVLKTGNTERYFGFLKSGGSKFPIETLAEAGVDMRSPEPVNAALALFERRVEELEGLLAVPSKTN
ncbi:MAG: oligoendopeptidase F [Verrucomicrobia bacterium]|nr:oligoendopeptidase F [Verrucomicrobiota bacterium]